MNRKSTKRNVRRFWKYIIGEDRAVVDAERERR